MDARDSQDAAQVSIALKKQHLLSVGVKGWLSFFRVAPIALRRMFSESQMREIRPSGLMRGASWLTHLGQLLPTLPPSARPKHFFQ